MKSRKERIEEEREYHADVWYAVWRSGGNPDAVSYERTQDAFYNSTPSEDTARRELQAQRPKPQLQCEEDWMEEHPGEMQ